MQNIQNIIDSKYLILSVIGEHAGEDTNTIFNRKINDMKLVGKTFWLIKSWKAKPNMVQEMGLVAKDDNSDLYCVFIAPSQKGGAVPTKQSEMAKEYSVNKRIWKKLPPNLSPVTGKIDKNAYALVFDDLYLSDGVLDLWDYSDFFELGKPIKISQGASTICVIKDQLHEVPEEDKIKSRLRKIVAIGRVSPPYAVYLR